MDLVWLCLQSHLCELMRVTISTLQEVPCHRWECVELNSNGTSGWNATTPSGYPVWFDFGTDNKIYITGGTTARFNNTPCHSVQLKLFMEGYYIGGGLNASVLFNQGVTSNLGITDSIQIQLRNSTFPHSLVAQTKTLLNINGTATCYFPIPNGNYYVVIRHRNSVETWSSNPITFSGLINYDFTTAQGQAYGSNQTEVEIGIWALYGRCESR